MPERTSDLALKASPSPLQPTCCVSEHGRHVRMPGICQSHTLNKHMWWADCIRSLDSIKIFDGFFFSCLFFYDPRSWGNITFRGKRLFFFFLALYLHILGKKQNIPSSHCANTSWKMVVCFCCATTEVMLKTKYSHCLPHHWLVCFYTFSLNQLNIHAALSDFKLQICLLVDLQTLSSPSTET